VIEVTPLHSTVLLLTDPDHAVPVTVARNGVRLIVYGRGDTLELRDVPLSAGVEVGDEIVTSGLGGRFPAGFPVGTVATLRPDDTHAFLVGNLKPAAKLDRGRDVLLLRPSVAATGLGIGDGQPAAVEERAGLGKGGASGGGNGRVPSAASATPGQPASPPMSNSQSSIPASPRSAATPPPARPATAPAASAAPVAPKQPEPSRIPNPESPIPAPKEPHQ